MNNYEDLCKMMIGKEITTMLCNGFFGRDAYDLKGAIITRVYEDYNSHDEYIIVVEVKKYNNRYDYAEFTEYWNDWKSVYKHLIDWTNEGGGI